VGRHLGVSEAWGDTWVILREGWAEARRAAAQGAKAIRQEAALTAAAVGPPGLVALQYAEMTG
jgi:hypothetical protein